MASKVLVPGVPFASLQGKVTKTPVEQHGSGLYISGGDPVARIAHLEHSVRFLQEQHRLMLSGLHAEIESLRERNRDLQFQLIFNKEPAKNSSTSDENENLVSSLRREVERLEREAAAARAEATACSHDLLGLQRLVDEQANKLRSLEEEATESEEGESAGALRARLGEAERLVRRLRADAERQRREVLGGAGVTNLLFDGAPAHHAHLQCMKSSLMRAGAVDAFGFPTMPAPYLHTADFWREPLREEYSMRGGGRQRRPNTLPALAVLPQQPRPPAYAHSYFTDLRARGYTERVKKSQTLNGESYTGKSPEETDHPRINPVITDNLQKINPEATYPELKIVVTKIIPHGNVNTSSSLTGARPRARRTHRKHASEHT
ncbi:uncharacterized protein LOC123710394 isoform X3 [Pieris brassicae]|uniref:uncharacterized protein LOC123710394 isoform X3 n=1 Tax=Pieris brassicae TaxID=7116 RepID=UPI001E65EB19|nr:uncharacterized protein LOC123710394 isoform X3 [Pieris brassicae]